MAALDLAGVSLGAVDLALLVHVVEALLGALTSLLRVVGVGDGALCADVSRCGIETCRKVLTEAAGNLLTV